MGSTLMDWILKLMTEANLYNGIKSIIFAWLITETLKRLARSYFKELSTDLVWLIAILMGTFTCYMLHWVSEAESIDPIFFFSLSVGLLTPILHNLIFIQLTKWFEDMLYKRWGMRINLRSALTGNPDYKHQCSKPKEDNSCPE